MWPQMLILILFGRFSVFPHFKSNQTESVARDFFLFSWSWCYRPWYSAGCNCRHDHQQKVPPMYNFAWSFSPLLQCRQFKIISVIFGTRGFTNHGRLTRLYNSLHNSLKVERKSLSKLRPTIKFLCACKRHHLLLVFPCLFEEIRPHASCSSQLLLSYYSGLKLINTIQCKFRSLWAKWTLPPIEDQVANFVNLFYKLSSILLL